MSSINELIGYVIDNSDDDDYNSALQEFLYNETANGRIMWTEEKYGKLKKFLLFGEYIYTKKRYVTYLGDIKITVDPEDVILRISKNNIEWEEELLQPLYQVIENTILVKSHSKTRDNFINFLKSLRWLKCT